MTSDAAKSLGDRINTLATPPKSAEVIKSAGDPQVGNLATPINSSGFARTFIGNLPAYRQGLTAQRRGLEIGMAHGYFLYGPFATLGPLRDTDFAGTAGLLSAIGLVIIATICLWLYAAVGTEKNLASYPVENPPATLSKPADWREFARGFFVGGLGGALVAFLVIKVVGTLLF